MSKHILEIPETLQRAATISTEGEGENKKLRISISSDTPYLRWDWRSDEEYWEVLDHAAGGFESGRLAKGLPMLFNHNRSQHLGRAGSFECDGKRIVVSDLKWSGDEFAQGKKSDMESGVLVDTSVGYSLIGDGVCTGEKDGKPVYKFKWEPHEFSLVTIPADYSVGVGREKDPNIKTREITVSKNSVDENQENRDNATTKTRTMPPTAEPQTLTPEEARKAGIAEFKARCKKIDEFVEGLSGQPEWQKAVAIIAAKHKEEEADWAKFHEAALRAFPKPAPLEASIEVVGERDMPKNLKSIGTRFVESEDFKRAFKSRGQGNRNAGIDLDFPTLGIRGKCNISQTRAGWTSSDLSAINVAPMQQLIALGVQRLTIMDLIAPGTTDKAAIPYPRENSFGSLNGVPFSTDPGVMPKAQNVGEGGEKPIWTPDLTTEVANVKKIAVMTKVPDEFLADFPGMRSYIDERLPYMVDTQTEAQILYGDGLGNNLEGIFTTTGVQTRAVDTANDSTVAGSLMQGLTDVRVGSMFEPDGFAFHPYDWETAKLLKDENDRFLVGGPYYIPYTNGVYMELNTIWGKPAVITTAVNYGQPLAGAWKLGAQYFLREGMRLEMTNANEDDFRRNLVAIRAEHRLGLATYRPLAFLEFTGWPARA